MPQETHELYEAAKKAIGAKEAADALNVGVQHYYKLCVDPNSLDAPVRDDVARIVNLMDKLAARPHAKPALIRWELFFVDLFNRVVRRDTPRPLTSACMPAKVGAMCKEFGDLLNNIGDPESPDFDAALIEKEGTEIMAQIAEFIHCANSVKKSANLKVS